MLIYYFIATILLATGTVFNGNRLVRILLLIAFLVVQTAFTIYGYIHLNKEELGFFAFDPLGVLFLCVLNVLSFTTIIHSILYLKNRQENEKRQSLYFFALILLIASMTCAYLASFIGVLWIFIEVTTLCVAVLIYHERTNLSLEASWKYVFICSIGITFAFVGIIFLGKALQEAGSVNLSFADMPQHLKNANVLWLKLAFLFMLVGFSTKMGLFPMHTITVDAHTVSPPPISAFISTTLMNVGFIAIFRTYSLMANTSIQPWMDQILLLCGSLSVFVSAVYLLKASHLKRMFAYSSLEHMGLTALGLASGGIGYFAAILHMVLHSLVKASAFYHIDQIYRTFHTYIIRKTGNYFQKNMTGAIVMIFIFVSITAMPPSGLFVSELLIFKSLFYSRQFLVLILTLLFLTFIFWALGKNLFKMIFVPPLELDENEVKPISAWESVSQFILLTAAAYLGLNPPAEFVQLINDSIISLPQ